MKKMATYRKVLSKELVPGNIYYDMMPNDLLPHTTMEFVNLAETAAHFKYLDGYTGYGTGDLVFRSRSPEKFAEQVYYEICQQTT